MAEHCTTKTTLYYTCAHSLVLVTHGPSCPHLTSYTPSGCPSSTESCYIVNSLCPCCTSEMAIPGGGRMPELEESVKQEIRTVYEGIMRRQMLQCEARRDGRA